MERKTNLKPRIGLYTMGLRTYWSQFAGLEARMKHYGAFIAEKLEAMGAEVVRYDLVDTEDTGLAAGEMFNSHNVDLVFAHAGTYVNSSCVLPVHQACKAPVVVLNLQPTTRINYAKTTTGEWLAHCGACPVPEIVNALHRAGIDCEVINGLLGMSETPEISLTNENTAERPEAKRAWAEIEEWVKAAMVKRNLQNSRFGFLGNTYNGMLDMYSDFTMLSGQTGIHVEVLEMCDLNRQLQTVTDAEIAEKKKEIEAFFTITEDKAADPLAQKPTEEQLTWSAKVAVAQEKLVEEYRLDGLCYYYHGVENGDYEKLQSGFIVGHSLLTAKGIPAQWKCYGSEDDKTIGHVFHVTINTPEAIRCNDDAAAFFREVLEA